MDSNGQHDMDTIKGQQTMNTQIYKIPKHFLRDHAARGCLRGVEYAHDDDGGIYGDAMYAKEVIERETKKHYYVKLTADQAQELLSDANYYRDGGGGGMDFFELGAIISSARATYAALIKQGLVRTFDTDLAGFY